GRRGLPRADRRAPGDPGHPRRPPPPPRLGGRRRAGRVRAAGPAAGRRRAHRRHPGRGPRRVHPRGRPRLLPGDRPHRPRHLPDPAARRGRAAGGRPAVPRPARLAAVGGLAHLDLARGRAPPAPRRLHGRRPPRVGGGRAAQLRARHARAGGRGAGGRRGDRPVEPGAPALVRPGVGRARRADRARPGVVLGPLARRPRRPAVGGRAAPRRRPGPAGGARARPGVVDDRAPGRGAARPGAGDPAAGGAVGGGGRPGGAASGRGDVRVSDETPGAAGAGTDLREVRAQLLAAGCTPEGLDRAERDGTLPLLAVERLLVDEPAVHDLEDVARRTGLRPRPVQHLWRSRGYPVPRPGELAFTDTDVELLAEVSRAVAGDVAPTELVLQMSRVIGSSMARIAAAQVDVISAGAAGEPRPGVLGDTEVTDDRIVRAARALLPIVPRVLAVAWRRHL